MSDLIAHRVSWRLDDKDRPVRVARANAAAAIFSWHVPQWVDTAALLVSELVTNALGHGAPPVTLTLSLLTDERSVPRKLLIEVSDATPVPPARRTPGENGGFGLGIIECLSELTVVANGHGKTMQALYDPAC